MNEQAECGMRNAECGLAEEEGVCFSIRHPPSAICHRFAWLTAGATLVLIVAGGLVTSNDAGDSVPDWPLSFGQVIPWAQLVGNVIYEYGHRVIGATVGVLTILLNLWLWRREPRRWVRRVGLIALVAVVAQGALGGIRVLLLEYRFPVAVVHACLAQIFFGLIVSLTVFTSESWSFVLSPLSLVLSQGPRTKDQGPGTFYLCAAATGSIFLQLVLGAAFRHRGLGIVPHIVGAVVVTVLLTWTVVKVLRIADCGLRIGRGETKVESKKPSASKLKARHRTFSDRLTPQSAISSYLAQPAIALARLLLIQLALGISAYLVRLASVDDPQPLLPMVSLTVAHVAGGALTLAMTVVLLLRIYHVVTPAAGVIRLSSGPQKAMP